MAFKYSYVLTGGIATGKSTVCSFLKSYGFSIIDADLIAKECLEQSKPELKELFGEKVFDNDIINRKKLAKIIFNSNEQREKLNNLVHPKIRKEIEKQAFEKEKLKKLYIVDIPLFFESGEYECKKSVVVYTSNKEQLKRLIFRDGLSEAEARKRIDSQMDIEKKKQIADWVIDNSSDEEHLKKETDKFIKHIRG